MCYLWLLVCISPPPFFFIAIPEQLLFRIAINSYSYNPDQKLWGAFTKIPHVFPLLFGLCNVHLKHPSYPESLYCRCFQHCLEEEGEGSSQSSVIYAEQLTYAKCFCWVSQGLLARIVARSILYRSPLAQVRLYLITLMVWKSFTGLLFFRPKCPEGKTCTLFQTKTVQMPHPLNKNVQK